MKKWIYRIVLIVCICVFGYSAFQLYTIYSEKRQVEKETETLKKNVEKGEVLDPDWESLQAENPDIIAWLYVPDCDISFPIVQGTDNSFYLTHTATKEYNPRGAVFLEAKANAQFQDDNSLVYGHSVEGGGMFTDLKQFTDSDFFKEHPNFYLLTPNGNYICNILTFAKTQDRSIYYTSSFGDYQQETVEGMIANAMYYNTLDTEGKRMITLSTCNLDYGFNSDQRYVLTGVLEETNEPIRIQE